MKKTLAILAAMAAILVVLCSAKPKKELRQVKYQTSIDCKNCVKKVTENISFEKGVEDLKAELSDKTVTITYNPVKTDTIKLADALHKLGYMAKVIEDIPLK